MVRSYCLSLCTKNGEFVGMDDDNKTDCVINDCCDACGCSAEIGTIITEGDDVYEYELQGETAKVKEDSERFDAVARNVSKEVQIQHTDTINGEMLLRKVTLKFSCTAEKMIFQMRTGLV